MKSKLKRYIGMAVCDLGLWIISNSPIKDDQDRVNKRRLIQYWKRFKNKK